MKRLIRLAIFGVVAMVVVCGAIFGLGFNRGAARLSPTNPPRPTAAAVVETDPTAIPAGYVSREMMGADWPLTVDYGDLACEGNKLVTFRSPMGDIYAVNAPARSQMGKRGWRDILTIDKPGADLFAFIDRGLKLCP